MGIGQFVKRLLNRPGGRGILGVLLSVDHWWTRGIWVPARWQSGTRDWVFSYPDATVHWPDPNLLFYDQKEAIAREVYFHRYTPVPGNVVVHVGAGSGWEAALFSRLVGREGHVYLIEAHPTTFLQLVRRINSERLSNVTTIEVAISDAPGAVRISDVVEHMQNRIVSDGPFVVPAETLASVHSQHSIEHVDLLTMNIEGSERQAVRTLPEIAPRIRHLAISCHDFKADRGGDVAMRTKQEVRAALAACGYQVFGRNTDDPRDWVRDYMYAER